MSGIIGVSPDMRSGLVGAWPAGHIIAHNSFTEEQNSYTNFGTAFLTTGNGWSGTTSSQTSKLIVFATGSSMTYFSAGASFARGVVALYYHTDDSTQGATPSGSVLGQDKAIGGYSVSLAGGRKDLYDSWTLCTTVSVSPNTTYHIQLASKMDTGYYFHVEAKTTGYVMEVQ